MIKQDSISNANREQLLFKRFLVVSVLTHFAFLFLDPSHFFFMPKPSLNEGSIEIDLIALDGAPSKKEEDLAPPTPMLPQIPKKFELDTPKKPDEMTIEDKNLPLKEEPKTQIEQKKLDEEDLTKVSLERLIKEVNRQKTKDKPKSKDLLMSNSLKDRKKQLETGLLHGTLTLGDTEGGYTSIIKNWIQRNYALPEIYELKNANIKAVIHLVLNEHGGIMKLVLGISSQNVLFDQLAMKTVEKSAPFPTPPSDWVGRTIILPFEPKVSGP